MIIMGVDPGFAITGYSIVEYENNKLKLLDVGAVNTKAGELFTWRLLQIDEKLNEIMQKYNVNSCKFNIYVRNLLRNVAFAVILHSE